MEICYCRKEEEKQTKEKSGLFYKHWKCGVNNLVPNTESGVRLCHRVDSRKSVQAE